MKHTNIYLHVGTVMAAVAMLIGCGGGGGDDTGTQNGDTTAALAFQGVWERKCAGTPVFMINGVYPETGGDKVEGTRGDAYLTITGTDDLIQIKNTYYIYDVKDANCTGKPILNLEIGGYPPEGVKGSPDEGFISINRGAQSFKRVGTALITSTTNPAIGEKGILATEFKNGTPPIFDSVVDGNYPPSGITSTPRFTPFYKWGPFLFGTAPATTPEAYYAAAITRDEERDIYTNRVINPGTFFDFLTLLGSSNPGNRSEIEIRDQAKKNLEMVYSPGIGYKRIAQIPDYELLLRSR